MDGRITRRLLGMLLARKAELGLEEVTDPRSRNGKWKLDTLVTATLAGMLAGCKSLADVEELTAHLSSTVRKRTGIFRRTPDTTLRDNVIRLEPEEVRKWIRVSAQKAYRRKALEPVGLPLSVVAMDGKGTAIQQMDGKYAQLHKKDGGMGAYGLVRTITCCLVSCAAKVVLEVVPMGKTNNEVGFFKTAFTQLLEHHKPSFDVVTYDAGAYSATNAKLVVDAGKHYLFGLKDERKFLRQRAEEVLGRSTNVQAFTEDVVNKGTNTRVVRRLFMAVAPNGYKSIKSVRTILRIHSQKVDGAGTILSEENRYYISSMQPTLLRPEEWLELVRRHWNVENNCHHVWDRLFEEDNRPWVTHSAQGFLVLLLLRRLAFNFLSLFRSVTQRSEEKRRTPWKNLFRWMARALETATEAQLQKLRTRQKVAFAVS